MVSAARIIKSFNATATKLKKKNVALIENIKSSMCNKLYLNHISQASDVQQDVNSHIPDRRNKFVLFLFCVY